MSSKDDEESSDNDDGVVKAAKHQSMKGKEAGDKSDNFDYYDSSDEEVSCDVVWFWNSDFNLINTEDCISIDKLITFLMFMPTSCGLNLLYIGQTNL